MINNVIGIDLGGTNFRIGLVDAENNIRHYRKLKTKLIAESKEPLQVIIHAIDDFLREEQIHSFDAISIGISSSVANDEKTVSSTSNILGTDGKPVFKNKNIGDEIESYFRVPVYINNDTKNILLYDMQVNNIGVSETVIGIYFGTGVGSAVWVNGRMLNGSNGVALDIGHVPYFNGTDVCKCGNIGCCECYASGWRLEEIQSRCFPKTNISELFVQHGDEPVLKNYVYACSHICSVMATIFNPSFLILGGGIIEMKAFPKERMRRDILMHVGKDVLNYGFQFVFSDNVKEKGVIGAAIFARMHSSGEVTLDDKASVAAV
ncbi:MAG: allose kinase [Bilifractor sp.]